MTWTYKYGSTEEATGTTQPVVDFLNGLSANAALGAKVATCDVDNYPSHWVVFYDPDFDPSPPGFTISWQWFCTTVEFHTDGDWSSAFDQIANQLNSLSPPVKAAYARFSMTDAYNRGVYLQLFWLDIV